MSKTKKDKMPTTGKQSKKISKPPKKKSTVVNDSESESEATISSENLLMPGISKLTNQIFRRAHPIAWSNVTGHLRWRTDRTTVIGPSTMSPENKVRAIVMELANPDWKHTTIIIQRKADAIERPEMIMNEVQE